MTHRRCNNCRKTKPIEEFYRRLDGHQHRCKGCNSEVSTIYSAAATRRRVLGESPAVALERARSLYFKKRVSA